MYFLVTVVLEAELKSIKPCKFENRSNCKWTHWHGLSCDISSLYCNTAIKCDKWTTINIKTVQYGVNYVYVNKKFCPAECNSGSTYSQSYTRELRAFCKNKQECDLSLWNTHTYDWKLHVIYDCQELTTMPKTSIHWMSTAHIPHISEVTIQNTSPGVVTTPLRYSKNIYTSSLKSPSDESRTQVPSTSSWPSHTKTYNNGGGRITESKTEENNASDTRPVKSQTESIKTQVPTTSPRPSHTTTSSNGASGVTESENEEKNAPDQFPVPAVAACVTAGIIGIVIVLIVNVCMRRRRRTIKSDQSNENTLQMQTVATNNTGNATTPVYWEDNQETDEHEYVNTALQNDPHTTDGTIEHAYVDINKQNATDTADGTFEHGYVNADKVVDSSDEYNTLNTRPTPFRIYPNYENLPKVRIQLPMIHTSHVSDDQTTMTDAIYSHLFLSHSCCVEAF